MGTELQRRGVPMDGIAWSAAAMATRPETVRSVHEDYLRAGAEILITNSFGTSRHVLTRRDRKMRTFTPSRSR